MQELKLVSIIIPVYNRENLVQKTIDSAINQTYKNIEIIIVDNCSTDNTWIVLQEYAKKDSRIRIYKNSANLGPVRNWQQCLGKAKGLYTKVLFSDDLINKNFVIDTINLFDNKTAFVLSKIILLKSNKNINTYDKYSHKQSYSTKIFLENILLNNKLRFSVSPGCAIFRTEDLRRSLLINIPNSDNLDFNIYGAGNDLLLFLLSSIQYSKINVSNKAISYFRHHKDSFSIKNDIKIYYDYAKLFFIKNHAKTFLPKFKAEIFLRKMKRKDYSNIYNDINSTIHFPHLILIVYFKFIKVIMHFFNIKRIGLYFAINKGIENSLKHNNHLLK